MDIIFPKLEKHQEDVWSAIEKDDGTGNIYVVVAKRQCGKSFLAALLLIKYALEKTSINIIVEPTLNQSRRIFKQITGMLEGSGLVKNANASLLNIDLVNGSEIIFKSAEQQESLRGMTASGVMVIDEGAFIKDEIYEILFPVTDVHKCPLLIISTPLFTDGYFYKLYVSPNSTSFDWSKYDTSMFLSESKLEEYRNTMSEMKFKSEYLGQFLTEGSYVFGNVTVRVSKEISNKKKVYCGIDWATGSGGDFTCLIFLNDQREVVDIVSFKDKEPSEQIDLIASIINESRDLKKVQVETNSIGAVYISELKKRVSKRSIIQEFTTTNESKRRIIEQLVTAFERGTIKIPDDKELIRELQHYAVEKLSKGYTYNGVAGYNDDYVMALAFAYDLTVNNNNYKVSFKNKRV